MPDLFYSTKDNFIDQLNLLKKDLIITAKKLGYRKRKLSILWSPAPEETLAENNILIIQPPIDKNTKAFEDKSTKYLADLMNEYNIYQYFLTYAHIIPTGRHSKKDIKDFSIWIHKIIDIIGPKLIVVLGEESELVFIKRKYLLKEFHGKIINYHFNIPVILSYPMEYYLEKMIYEDENYKNFIKDNDWKFIKKEYDRRIKCQ